MSKNLWHNDSDTMSSDYLMLSTGITQNDLTKLQSQIEYLESNNILVKFICVDVANGYMFKLVDFCKNLRILYPYKTIIAGNVVSREITEELIINGKVDMLRSVSVLARCAQPVFKPGLECHSFRQLWNVLTLLMD